MPSVHYFYRNSARIAPRLIVLACVALPFLNGCAAAQARGKLIAANQEVTSMCQQAEQLINSGRTSDAISLLNRAAAADPTSGEVHGYLGMAFQNSGDPGRAISEYQKALSLNPQMTFINVNLGTCYMNMSKLDQALPYFQSYLQANPDAPDAAQVRGYIQQAGARANQQSLKSVVEKGQSLLNQRQYEPACAAFRQAISINPNFAPAHFYLGYALAEGGQHQQAIGEFQSALQFDPGLKEAILNIGSNYQSTGDCASAITWYERYLQEKPGSAKAGEIRSRISGLKQQMAGNQNNGSMMGQHNGGSSQDDYLANAQSGGRLFRWYKAPIRVCIATGANVPCYQNSYGPALIDAFLQWAKASNNSISFTQVGDPSQADIICTWTADANALVDGNRAVEGGLTKLSAQPGPNNTAAITGARIVLLTNRSGNPLSDDQMRVVCLHEVGHALGINGHSNNNRDIMFFSETSGAQPALSMRDKTTILHLYSNN
jgi:tetratricopeptide (TPR) repeat protein